MTVCVFTGPTLGAADGRVVLDARYLPPARQGDVYRAVQRHHPRVIGLVDGYFQDVPSVWHKEILWAMAEGVHVFGSASMGALRAAELGPYGMRGVGRIFEAFRDGRLPSCEEERFEDDDEVAVVHRPAEAGFVPLSEAMVNVRLTLAAAAGSGVLSEATRAALVRIAKRLFYPERAYEAILDRGARAGLPASELDGLRAWLPGGRVDQKRADALAMLGAIRELLAADPGPCRVGYVLQPSDMWRHATAWFEAPSPEADGERRVFEALVLDEVRLDGPAYREACRGALLRCLARDGQAGGIVEAGAAERAGARRALRRRLGLADQAALDAWLRANDLDGGGWARLVDDEARLRALERQWAEALEAHVLDHLRVTGAYAGYAARARAKRRALGDGPGSGTLDEWTRCLATAWYFEGRGTLVPEDVRAHAVSLGFPDLDAFHRALARERAFVTACQTVPPSPVATGPPSAGAPPE